MAHRNSLIFLYDVIEFAKIVGEATLDLRQTKHEATEELLRSFHSATVFLMDFVKSSTAGKTAFRLGCV